MLATAEVTAVPNNHDRVGGEFAWHAADRRSPGLAKSFPSTGERCRTEALCAGRPTPHSADRRSPDLAKAFTTTVETCGRRNGEVRRPAPSAASEQGDLRQKLCQF